MSKEKLICKECGKTSTYQVTESQYCCGECNHVHPEKVHPDDVQRVRAQLCPSCFRKELKQQLFDEVGGILGNISITPEPETLVELAKALVSFGKTDYYQASEYMVFLALKDNQDPEEGILMIPDGDKSTLNRKFVK